MLVAFRCDGDERIGAGHVARCAQLARAFRWRGVDVVMAGRYEGVAADLVAGLPLSATLPEDADAVVVDSYELPAGEVEALARRVPVAVVEDGPAAAAVTAVLAYHLDSAERTAVPDGAVAVVGPAYAPIRPGCVRARRQRTLEQGLVTVGGGSAGEHLIDAATEALGGLVESVQTVRPGDMTPDEMLELIAAADVAVSAAGSTPYELAGAGVPSVVVAVADNQLPIARTFGAAGIALGLEEPSALGEAVRQLGDQAVRESLATAGPAVVDGYGAFRARDALLAAFEGQPQPRVLRYRPASKADAELLHEWRNQPDVRAVSRSTDPVPFDDHVSWLESALGDADRSLLVVEAEGEPVGTVRFDRQKDKAEISVTMAPGHRGGGFGSQAIHEAAELELAARPELDAVLAEVQDSNVRSLRAFERAGYRRLPDRPADDRVLLALERRSFGGPLH